VGHIGREGTHETAGGSGPSNAQERTGATLTDFPRAQPLGDAVHWNVEGLPTSVEIAPEVLTGLQRILAESATEFGGVLLGRV